MARNFMGSDEWFRLWDEDKQSMIDTMVKNMADDLEAGYDYFGESIRKQKDAIRDYKEEYDRHLECFSGWDEDKINRWCYFDLKKRGAIS